MVNDGYPLVNIYITMERSTIFHGQINYFYGKFPVRKLLVKQWVTTIIPLLSGQLSHCSLFLYGNFPVRKLLVKQRLTSIFLWFSYGFPMETTETPGKPRHGNSLPSLVPVPLLPADLATAMAPVRPLAPFAVLVERRGTKVWVWVTGATCHIYKVS